MSPAVQRIRRTLALVAANDSETSIGGDLDSDELDEIERSAVDLGLVVTRSGSVYTVRCHPSRGAR